MEESNVYSSSTTICVVMICVMMTILVYPTSLIWSNSPFTKLRYNKMICVMMTIHF